MRRETSLSELLPQLDGTMAELSETKAAARREAKALAKERQLAERRRRYGISALILATRALHVFREVFSRQPQCRRCCCLQHPKSSAAVLWPCSFACSTAVVPSLILVSVSTF